MSLITLRRSRVSRAPQAASRRHARAQSHREELRDLRHQLDGAGRLIEGLRLALAENEQQRRSEVNRLTQALVVRTHELLDEREAHFDTQRDLDAAVRANESNAGAVTVQTDVTVLRAAVADQFVDAPVPGPQYAAYERVMSPPIRVMPAWEAPFATVDPGRVPPVRAMAGVR